MRKERLVIQSCLLVAYMVVTYPHYFNRCVNVGRLKGPLQPCWQCCTGGVRRRCPAHTQPSNQMPGWTTISISALMHGTQARLYYGMLTLILVLFIRQVWVQTHFAEALLNALPPALRQGPVARQRCKEVLSIIGPPSGMVSRVCKLTAAGGTS